MKCSSEMLQNLLYFTFSLMNVLVYVNIDQGIHKGKSKVTRNKKRKKLHGFSYTQNIANSEAFR